MEKISVIYWSQTGNTATMAAAIGEGIKAAGKEADVVEVNAASLDQLKKATVFALLWELKCWKKQKWSHLWKK